MNVIEGSPAIRHRRDIDGLRSLAVLPITLFHAGIPGVSGGYVGVDIFFVISGFLITGIIEREFSNHQFKFLNFYERRIRRIFPALSGVIIFSFIGAYFFLLPSEVSDFSNSALSTLFFVSNIYFYNKSGYFDTSSEYRPLLHTWSLGVEEQFYILFPILLILALRYWRKGSRVILALCAALSLALCIHRTPDSPTMAFYLISSRAWELFTGALIALGTVPKIMYTPAREALSALGVAFIIMAIVLFDSKTSFPGVAALLPVTGTALLLIYGEGTTTGRFLSMAPLVFIGIISYSLYLWHWPLIVFARDLGVLDGRIAPAIATVLLSIALAYLSYRFIETPFRNRANFGPRRIYVLAGVTSVGLLAIACGFLYSDGFRARYSAQALAFDDSQTDVSPMRTPCHPSAGVADPRRACVFGGAHPDTAMWADSHGVELAYAMGSGAHPVRSITYSACPPALDFNLPAKPNCREHNLVTLNYILSNSDIRTVVVTAHYRQYMEYPEFASGFEKAITKLLGAGKSVIVIAPVPGESDRNLPMRLARQGIFHVSLSEFENQEKDIIALLVKLRRKGATLVWPSDFFCRAGVCEVTLSGHPLLFDSDHLSMTAARYLAARMAHQPQADGAGTKLRHKDRS